MGKNARTVVLLALSLLVAAADATPVLELTSGQHVAVIGNTLADQMQHDGWFETLVHAKYPTHQLVWRNLAVAGDEVAFRHRSENFGTPDEWLKKVGADVVLAFFGFNESFKGEAGVAKFKEQLAEFLKDTTSRNYGGRGKAPPRVPELFPGGFDHRLELLATSGCSFRTDFCSAGPFSKSYRARGISVSAFSICR